MALHPLLAVLLLAAGAANPFAAGVKQPEEIKGIKKIDDTHYSMETHTCEVIQANREAPMEGRATFSPDGLILTGTSGKSAALQLGLREGDRLLRLNGREMHEGDVPALGICSGASRSSIEVMRDGDVTRIEYVIKDPVAQP